MKDEQEAGVENLLKDLDLGGHAKPSSLLQVPRRQLPPRQTAGT